MPVAKIRDQKDLTKIAPHSVELYAEIPLTSLTAYSLFWLHEWQLPRTIESIAILNWRLFPEKFAMVGFPEFPDAFRTNRSLLQMQPKYRNLLTGAAVKGFSLNEKGKEKASELIESLGPPKSGSGDPLGTAPKPKAQKISTAARSIEPEREIERVRKSKLFAKWNEGLMTDRDLIHAHSMLGIFEHTPKSVRARAMKELQQAADKAGDPQVAEFLQAIRRTFPQLLREE